MLQPLRNFEVFHHGKANHHNDDSHDSLIRKEIRDRHVGYAVFATAIRISPILLLWEGNVLSKGIWLHAGYQNVGIEFARQDYPKRRSLVHINFTFALTITRRGWHLSLRSTCMCQMFDGRQVLLNPGSVNHGSIRECLGVVRLMTVISVTLTRDHEVSRLLFMSWNRWRYEFETSVGAGGNFDFAEIYVDWYHNGSRDFAHNRWLIYPCSCQIDENGLLDDFGP